MEKRCGKDRRSGKERRYHDATILAPDNRSGHDRRSGKDRRRLPWVVEVKHLSDRAPFRLVGI